MTTVILGALAYIVPTFFMAYVWHLVVFKKWYENWGFADVPNIPLGFLSIVVQGVVFSVLYAQASFNQSSFVDALPHMLLWGVVLWTVHVVGAMAKNSKERNFGYFGFETLYLFLQFVLFTTIISGIVY